MIAEGTMNKVAGESEGTGRKFDQKSARSSERERRISKGKREGKSCCSPILNQSLIASAAAKQTKHHAIRKLKERISVQVSAGSPLSSSSLFCSSALVVIFSFFIKETASSFFSWVPRSTNCTRDGSCPVRRLSSTK